MLYWTTKEEYSETTNNEVIKQVTFEAPVLKLIRSIPFVSIILITGYINLISEQMNLLFCDSFDRCWKVIWIDDCK